MPGVFGWLVHAAVQAEKGDGSSLVEKVTVRWVLRSPGQEEDEVTAVSGTGGKGKAACASKAPGL